MWLIILTGLIAAGVVTKKNEWSKTQDMRRAEEQSRLQVYCVIALVIAALLFLIAL